MGTDTVSPFPSAGLYEHSQDVVGPAEHGPDAVWLRVLTLGASMPLQGFELDMVRMPLGQLSTAQVQRGYHVLRRLRNALAGLNSDSLETLSTEFYTTIPHSFKQSRPVRLCASHLGQAAQSHHGLGPYLPVCMPTIQTYCLGRLGAFLQQSASLRTSSNLWQLTLHTKHPKGCSSPGCCLQQRAQSPCGGQLSNVAAMLSASAASALGHTLILQPYVPEHLASSCVRLDGVISVSALHLVFLLCSCDGLVRRRYSLWLPA